MTETLQEETREAPEMPLHMRRDGFDPVPEMAALRDDEGVRAGGDGLRDARVPGHPARGRQGRARRQRPVQQRQPPGLRRPRGPDSSAPRSATGCGRATCSASTRPSTPGCAACSPRSSRSGGCGGWSRASSRSSTTHLDAMEKAGPPADLVADFALPIPSLVICELLGVPYADRDGVPARARAACSTSRCRWTSASSWAGRAASTWPTWSRGRRPQPGDDMLGMLVREHGHELTTDELIGIAGLLLIAGHETTSNMLGLGTLALLRHPEQLALVRDDPAAVGAGRRGAAALPRHRALAASRGPRPRTSRSAASRSRPTRW